MQVDKLYYEKTADLTIDIEVAGVHLQHEGKGLFLRRALDKDYYPGAWGLPAGKVDPGETVREGAVRELFEETGIQVEQETLAEVKTIYIETAHCTYAFTTFHLDVNEKAEVKLNSESIAYGWFTPEEIKQQPLILFGKEVVESIENYRQEKL